MTNAELAAALERAEARAKRAEAERQTVSVERDEARRQVDRPASHRVVRPAALERRCARGPSHPTPVFDAIVASAVRLLQARSGMVTGSPAIGSSA